MAILSQQKGYSTAPKKIAVVQWWPITKSVKELMDFLGFARYYRRFIWRYGIIIKPLAGLLKEGFYWDEMATSSFNMLKEALTSAPVLALPNSSLLFVVEIDVCHMGLGQC